jgi:hypothetical protein
MGFSGFGEVALLNGTGEDSSGHERTPEDIFSTKKGLTGFWENELAVDGKDEKDLKDVNDRPRSVRRQIDGQSNGVILRTPAEKEKMQSEKFKTGRVDAGQVCRLEVRDTADSEICATTDDVRARVFHGAIIHPVFRLLRRMGFECECNLYYR